jgi:5-methylcytosine-specific restriction endonuclease McrA
MSHKSIDGVIHRKCTGCNEWIPENDEYFYMKNKKYPEKGYIAKCKRCSLKDTQDYQERNKEIVVQKKKIEHQINKKYYNEVSKRWRDNNQEWKQEYQKNYQNDNPDKMQQYRINREQNKKHTITSAEWQGCLEYFNRSCAYCGLPESKHYTAFRGEIKLTSLHKEHAINNGENDLSNCIPSCKSCNDQKWSRDFDDWYNEDNERYSKERYDKIIKWLSGDYLLHIGKKTKRNIKK